MRISVCFQASPDLFSSVEMRRWLYSALTVDDISEFLKGIKLPNLTELFRENDVDEILLLMLKDKDLEHLGVANGFSHRKIVTKLRVHLENLVTKHGQWL